MLDVRTLVPEGNQKTRNSKYSVNEGLQRLIILAKKSFLIYKEKYFFMGTNSLISVQKRWSLRNDCSNILLYQHQIGK